MKLELSKLLSGIGLLKTEEIFRDKINLDIENTSDIR